MLPNTFLHPFTHTDKIVFNAGSVFAEAEKPLRLHRKKIGTSIVKSLQI
jgi:hypothetical protein